MERKRLKLEDLPPADTIIGYGDSGFGPLFLHWATEDTDVGQAAKEAGFDILLLNMDEDLGSDHQLCVDHFEYGQDAAVSLRRWQPTEQGDGWLLSGMHDTEDGPVALFLRPSPVRSA